MPRDAGLSPDLVRVRHMIDAIEETLSFVEDKKRKDLEGDRMRALSLMQEIQIIGEAAGKVSKAFQEKHAEIPWPLIVGIRNRLIHGYFDVDLDVVWKTVTEDLPELLERLRKIIG